MKIKVSEATKPQLNWLVAKCNQDWTDEDRWMNTLGYVDSGDPDDEPYQPTTDWAQGGPIIERKEINLTCYSPPKIGINWWSATIIRAGTLTVEEIGQGPTPLIAAMRAYVISECGEEVEIPEELL